MKDTGVFYQLSHCVISASKYEGLPFSVMEALHYNVPVIASNVKGHKDLIIDGFNGHLYEYDNDAQLCDLLKKISDINIHADLRKNAKLEGKYYIKDIKNNFATCIFNIKI